VALLGAVGGSRPAIHQARALKDFAPRERVVVATEVFNAMSDAPRRLEAPYVPHRVLGI
jgi:hypothetical protein